jgi:hypothetical protein
MSLHLAYKTDQQITAFVMETMQTFSALSPSERRRLREQNRRWFVAGGANAVKPDGDLGFETSYDNLDFS